jgi:hypothetical protein
VIVAVAVCPGAPLLVSGLAPGLATIAQRLIDACTAAVGSLRGAERILLLTSGPRARDRGAGARRPSLRHPPGTLVSTAPLTDSRLVAGYSSVLAGAAPLAASTTTVPTPPGVGVIVGAALLDAAGVTAPTTAVELADVGGPGESPPVTGTDLAFLRGVIGGPQDRVALLIIGEGTASRGPDSPGGGHADAQAFDALLAGALASGDPAALDAAVTSGRQYASEMLWTSGPSLAALAALCADLPPTRAELPYDDAPFGVGYLVATWTWA